MRGVWVFGEIPSNSVDLAHWGVGRGLSIAMGNLFHAVFFVIYLPRELGSDPRYHHEFGMKVMKGKDVHFVRASVFCFSSLYLVFDGYRLPSLHLLSREFK
jgi:hypothetical protein